MGQGSSKIKVKNPLWYGRWGLYSLKITSGNIGVPRYFPRVKGDRNIQVTTQSSFRIKKVYSIISNCLSVLKSHCYTQGKENSGSIFCTELNMTVLNNSWPCIKIIRHDDKTSKGVYYIISYHTILYYIILYYIILYYIILYYIILYYIILYYIILYYIILYYIIYIVCFTHVLANIKAIL